VYKIKENKISVEEDFAYISQLKNIDIELRVRDTSDRRPLVQ